MQFSLISFFIGLTWTTFSNVPDVAGELFPPLAANAGDTPSATLLWMLNANNLAQLLAMPFALWILSRPPHGRTGLRLTVILATITLLIQSALWAAATLAPDAPWVTAALIAPAIAKKGSV